MRVQGGTERCRTGPRAAALGLPPARVSWVLGYRFSGSFGFAERYFSGVITHRHSLVGLHGFGATRRGLTGVGGVAFTLPLKPIAEVEARVGLRFGDTRRWAVSALVRLGRDIGHQERAPMPQLGAFFLAKSRSEPHMPS